MVAGVAQEACAVVVLEAVAAAAVVVAVEEVVQAAKDLGQGQE